MSRSWLQQAARVAIPLGLVGTLFLADSVNAAERKAAPGALKLKITETPLGYIPSLVEKSNWVISADNTKAAIAVRRGGGWSVWFNGKEMGPYKQVKSVTFSPDSERFVFGATRGPGQAVLVRHGQELSTSNLASPVLYSPDSQHLAYFDGRSQEGISWLKIFVVRDSQPGPEFDSRSSDEFLFSPDSQRLAYGAGRFAPAVAGRPSSTHEALPGPVAVDSVVVVDGVESRAYDAIGKDTLQFSADSRHYAFVGLRAGKSRVVVDAKEGRQYEEINAPSLGLSPNGQQVAYAAQREGKWRMVVNDQEEEPFELPADCRVAFSPDSQEMAYAAQMEGQKRVVVDGHPGPALEEMDAGGIAFSPDSRHYAYIAQVGGKVRLMLDGKPSGTSSGRCPGEKPWFSPDSRRVAWIAFHGAKVLVAEADREGQECDDILQGSVKFSSDSKHLAYIGVVGKKSVILLDGREVRSYDDTGYKLVFTGPRHFRVIAQRFDDSFREQLVKVDVELEE